MISGSIARRYAKALVSIGEEKGTLLGLQREIQRMAELWSSNHELRLTMTHPTIDGVAKQKIWNSVILRLGISATSKNFLLLLQKKGRTSELPNIAREITILVDIKENRLNTEVISASPLPDNITEELRAALTRYTGKKIVLSKKEDPSILGGVVTRVGDMMYDGSLKTGLKRIKEAMLR